jgi:hypothetical protein
MNPKLLLLLLGAFVAGVFVGAGQWFALFVFVAALAAWRWLEPPPPSDLPLSVPSQPRPGSPPGRFSS